MNTEATDIFSRERALITGATSGIGLHLAHVFAKHRHNLILVAPVSAELDRVAGRLAGQHGVEVETVTADLTRWDDADDRFAALVDRVGILCNNAGHGFRGPFHEVPVEKHLSMMTLNVEAVLRLTSLFLPAFVARGAGRILNTASIAGFEPGPLMATYHATKAFVLSLSESLATENESTGVTITALCPGPVDTDFFEKAEMPESRAFQKANLMAPQDVAGKAYKALMAGERVVVPGSVNKANVFSRRFTSTSAQARMNRKMYEDVPAGHHQRNRGARERPASAKHLH